MTIESAISKQTMHGDGTVRAFPFTFKAWEGQVRVILTDPDGMERDATAACAIMLYDSGEAGGVVTYPAAAGQPALPPGCKLTVVRAMRFIQDTDLVTGSNYLSEVIEERLDRLTAQDQELKEKLDRAVVVSVSSDALPKTAEQMYDEVNTIADRAEHAVTRAAGVLTLAEEARDLAVTAAGMATATAGELQTLSIAVDDAPYGHMASGAYNVTSGMLTLRVPEGRPGMQGPPGRDGRDGRDGKNGLDGRHGKDGVRGPEGPPGPAGEKGPLGDSPLPLTFGNFRLAEDGCMYFDYYGDVSSTDFAIDPETGMLEVTI